MMEEVLKAQKANELVQAGESENGCEIPRVSERVRSEKRKMEKEGEGNFVDGRRKRPDSRAVAGSDTTRRAQPDYGDTP